jgi:hypothetical protein
LLYAARELLYLFALMPLLWIARGSGTMISAGTIASFDFGERRGKCRFIAPPGDASRQPAQQRVAGKTF